MLKSLLPRLLLLVAAVPIAASAGAARTGSDPASGVVKATLPNGLRVLVRPRHTAPVVTTMMWYRVGSRDELPGATGLAHFLEHLMFKGTKKLAKGAVDRITYQNGGSNNAFTFNDYTGYEFNLPRDRWKVALEIEADRMRNCTFDAKEFEAERQVVMEERRGGQDDPEQNFGEQLNAMAFLAHPYRNPVIGWMEDLKRVTRDEVYAFYLKYYVPANATLVIAGDVPAPEALAAARAAFAGVPKLPAPANRSVQEPPQAASRRLRMTLPTQVPRLQILFPIPNRKSQDTYALHLLEYALGEGKLSRLYRRLVEGDRTAADAGADIGVYRDLGVFAVSANAKPGVVPDQLEQAVWQELERLGRRPLEARELERAKNQFYADWVRAIDTANDLASVLGEADALGGYEYLTTLLAHVQAVTAEGVQAAAAKYLTRERSSVGHLHPKAEGGRMKDEASLQPGLPRTAGRSGASPHPSSLIPHPSKAQRPAPFKPLTPTEKILPNGMRLILLENHDLPTVTLSTRVDAGSFNETDAQSGLANLVGRMLEEGTRTRSHRAISEALEQVGASLEAAPGRPSTYLSLTALTQHVDDLLPLYAEMIRAPSCPQDRMELERDRVFVEIKEAADNARTVARNAFNELVYGRHPAHRPVIGTEATVRRIRQNDLEAYHNRWYRPDNTTLVAVGDFRAAELLGRLEAAFADWPRREGAPTATLPEVIRQPEKRERRVTMDKSQTQIMLGHLGVRRTNPDYFALRVLDAILGEGVGGGFTARIPYQLRDVQGLAYTVGSSITSTAGKEPGVFIASLGTEPGKEQAAIQALLKEIRRIRTSPVTDSELREGRDYLADSYVFAFQTNAQLADYLHTVQYYGLGYNYRQRFPAEIRRVTRADVLRAAQKYLDPERYSLVVVAPTAEPKPSTRGE